MNELYKSNYRLDIHLDGNGAKPHQIFYADDVDKLLEAAWKLDIRPDTIFIIWKEFGDSIPTRHVLSVNPSYHKSIDEVKECLMKRIAEIGDPIPAPENPPVKWIE